MRATPVPIPNTVVKPHSVDGTAALQLWESRTLPDLNSKPASFEAGLLMSRPYADQDPRDPDGDECGIE